MAQFDPALREETWLFEKIGEGDGSNPLYRRLRFNLVNYDGSPDAVLEPVNDVATSTQDTVIVTNSHFGRIRRLEFVSAGSCFADGVHRFD